MPPFSYLAAERIERLFARVVWRPVLGTAVHQGNPAECGRAAAFALAAGRLAWFGGFELDDPEVLADAGAAASLGLDAALQAGGDIARDGPMEAAALRLLGPVRTTSRPWSPTGACSRASCAWLGAERGIPG